MLDAKVEPWAHRNPAMLDHLLQGVQDLDPHQVHDQHRQQTQTWPGKQKGSLYNSGRSRVDLTQLEAFLLNLLVLHRHT